MHVCIPGVGLILSLFITEDCDEDHESVYEGKEELAGSSATKKTRARKIQKSPTKKVSCTCFILQSISMHLN